MFFLIILISAGMSGIASGMTSTPETRVADFLKTKKDQIGHYVEYQGADHFRKMVEREDNRTLINRNLALALSGDYQADRTNFLAKLAEVGASLVAKRLGSRIEWPEKINSEDFLQAVDLGEHARDFLIDNDSQKLIKAIFRQNDPELVLEKLSLPESVRNDCMRVAVESIVTDFFDAFDRKNESSMIGAARHLAKITSRYPELKKIVNEIRHNGMRPLDAALQYLEDTQKIDIQFCAYQIDDAQTALWGVLRDIGRSMPYDAIFKKDSKTNQIGDIARKIAQRSSSDGAEQARFAHCVRYLLKSFIYDFRKVEDLFKRFADAADPENKKKMRDELIDFLDRLFQIQQDYKIPLFDPKGGAPIFDNHILISAIERDDIDLVQKLRRLGTSLEPFSGSKRSSSPLMALQSTAMLSALHSEGGLDLNVPAYGISACPVWAHLYKNNSGKDAELLKEIAKNYPLQIVDDPDEKQSYNPLLIIFKTMNQDLIQTALANQKAVFAATDKKELLKAAPYSEAVATIAHMLSPEEKIAVLDALPDIVATWEKEPFSGYKVAALAPLGPKAVLEKLTAEQQQKLLRYSDFMKLYIDASDSADDNFIKKALEDVSNKEDLEALLASSRGQYVRDLLAQDGAHYLVGWVKNKKFIAHFAPILMAEITGIRDHFVKALQLLTPDDAQELFLSFLQSAQNSTQVAALMSETSNYSTPLLTNQDLLAALIQWKNVSDRENMAKALIDGLSQQQRADFFASIPKQAPQKASAVVAIIGNDLYQKYFLELCAYSLLELTSAARFS